VRYLFLIPIGLNCGAILPGVLGLPLSRQDAPQLFAILFSAAVVTSVGSGLIAWSLQGWAQQWLVLRIKLPVWIAHAICLLISSIALTRMDGLEEYFLFLGSLMLMLVVGALVNLVTLPLALAHAARKEEQKGLLPPL
jgi:hypothetical protein